MKLAIAGLLAFVAVAQAGVITQYSSVPHGHVYGHGYAHATPVTYAVHGHAYNQYVHQDGHYDHAYDHHNYDHHNGQYDHSYDHHDHHGYAHAYHHAPAAVSVHAHHVPAVHVAHAPVHVAHHAATYTAATKGAVHTAPLEGHVVSQTSLNLAPAPGTH